MGTGVISLISQLTGKVNIGVGAISLFFVIGLIVFNRACGDGSFDVTGERLTAEKVPYFWAFRASDRQRRGAKMAAKTLMWEHIKGNVRRVE